MKTCWQLETFVCPCYGSDDGAISFSYERCRFLVIPGARSVPPTALQDRFPHTPETDPSD